ncbi:hypothetical protein BGW39_007558 [Mortierella sp. 14UC]|nr:hypothetical protein BGW39_007558 [Mortierella sp. 14UC]
MVCSQPFFVLTPVSYPAYARTVNKLYVVGGAKLAEMGDFGIPQFISLDLAIPWSTASPAWTKLANGPTQDIFPAVFSADEQTMFTFHIKGTNSPWLYNVQNNTWQESTAKFQNAALNGLGAVADPRTGLVYLAGGFEGASYDAPYLKYMDIFDSVTQTIHTVDMPDPAEVFPVRLFYANVWSKHLNSIIYWGGVNKFGEAVHSSVQNGVTELATDTMTWSTMATIRTAPEARDGHCMTANEDGTKVVIVGGQLRNGSVVGDLWVLDVPTATWSQGLSGPIRASAVCTIAGHQVIIWGGRNSSTMNAPSEMLIYNLKSSTYTKQYSPPAFYKDLQSPPALTRTTAPWATEGSTLTNEDQKRSSVSVGAVVGSALGGLVLIGAAAGFFLATVQAYLGDWEGCWDGCEEEED